MDYGLIMELDNLTVRDCVKLFVEEGLTAIVHDGRILNLERENRNERN